MSLESLEESIIEWATERGIFEKADFGSQFEKTCEEVGELARGLIESDYNKTRDAIGDVVVTLILLADMHGMSLQECLQAAYNEIKDRTGKMVDGVFVKDK